MRHAAESCARIDRYERASEVAAAIVKPQRRSEAFVSLARIAAKSKAETAVEMVEHAILVARLVDLEDFDAIYGPVETMLKAAACAWDLGLRTEALDVAHEMLGVAGGLCDPIYGPEGLKIAIEIFTSARDREGLEIAIGLAEALDDNTFREDALSTTVTAMAKSGFLDRALCVSQDHNTGHTRASLAEAALVGGHQAQAINLLDAALDEGDALVPVNARARALRACLTILSGWALACEGAADVGRCGSGDLQVRRAALPERPDG